MRMSFYQSQTSPGPVSDWIGGRRCWTRSGAPSQAASAGKLEIMGEASCTWLVTGVIIHLLGWATINPGILGFPDLVGNPPKQNLKGIHRWIKQEILTPPELVAKGKWDMGASQKLPCWWGIHHLLRQAHLAWLPNVEAPNYTAWPAWLISKKSWKHYLATKHGIDAFPLKLKLRFLWPYLIARRYSKIGERNIQPIWQFSQSECLECVLC